MDLSREVYQGDGKSVDISLPFGSAESKAVTKVLSDESERQVNDLFVLAFPVSSIDGEGRPVFDTTKPVFKKYFTKQELLQAHAQDSHYSGGAVQVQNFPTGTYVFEGVANVLTSEYVNEDLYESLEAVDSWTAYCNVRASLIKTSSVDRIAPAMLMSGTYRETDYHGDHRTHNPVTVTTAGQLSGFLHLVRVDARVKFVITNNISRVKSFTLESWQVFNVPDDVKVFSESGSTPLSTSNSSVFTTFTSKDPQHSFEFYIPEYVFTSTEGALDMIRKREKRNDADTQWLFAPENSPYVVFKGKMEMLVYDEETHTDNVNRYADVAFTVHLGACDGAAEADKAKDFKTDRNTKYTYNITINGVNDVVVEAKKEAGEYNHGVEGVVIDNVGGVTFNFDSHYGVANIALSKNDLKKMSIQLTSVLGEQYFKRDNEGHVLEQNINTATEDFQAFRFAFEPVSSEHAYKVTPVQIFRDRFVSYSKTYDAGKYMVRQHNEVNQAKDANHTFALYDLMSMLEGLPFGDGEAQYADQALISHLDAAMASPENKYASKDDIPVIFTMFVNENVYYGTYGGVVEDWHHHVNSVDRVLRMFTTSDLSEDKKSEYIRGRYNFTQKYCQTYYSDLNNEALCVEFVNEHHHKDIKNTKGANISAGGSVKSGWKYVNDELNGKSWDAGSDQTIPLCDHYNAFRTLYAENGAYAKKIPGSTDSNDYEAIYASLSRNRDLNRDGVIDSKELKWFLASMEQYIQITVGGAALERKVFVPDDYNNWNETVDGPKGSIFGNVRFHYCGVEMRSKLWSEEGYTVGNQSVMNPAESSDGWNKNPWELLCVRMLVDHSRVGEEELYWNDFDDLYYWSNQDKQVISMDKYRSNLHRQPVTSWIDLHTNDNDIANSTFTHFQFAKNDAALVDRDPGELNLVDRMHLNTYCTEYSQESDGSDRGTWRIPNQRETAVMRYLAGISNTTQPNGGAYYLSCSTWPFPSSGQRTKDGHLEVIDFCTIGMNPTKSSPSGQLSQNFLRVRCVRDTDQAGNFVGRPEYGNPVNFNAGVFGCTYVGDFADYTVSATMDASMVSSVSVTIDGYPASTKGSGTVISSVNGANVTKSEVTVVWTIVTTAGKTLNYRQSYQLPAKYYVFANKRAGATRYAYVNTSEVSVLDGSNNPLGSNIEALDAQYKWKLVVSTTDLANVTDIHDEVIYYLYNEGYKAFLCAPSNYGAQANTLPISGTPARIKIKTVVQDGVTYRTMYLIDGGGTRRGWINFLGSGFGYWANGGDQSGDDGNKWIFNSAVHHGQMPLLFSFADNYVVSGSAYSVSIETNPDVVIGNVTIGGVTAAVTGAAGNYTATVTGGISPTVSTIETVWNISMGSDSYVKRHTYNRSIKYYVISSEAGPQQYAYADAGTNRTAADATPYTGAIEDLDAAHQWIFTTSKTAVGVEPVNANVFGTSTAYYLYNRGAGKYIAGPLNTSEFGYLTIGEAQDRMRVKVEGRSGGRYSFLFSESGIGNHCASTYRSNGGSWVEDPAVFGVFQTGSRDRTATRFNLLPIYE